MRLEDTIENNKNKEYVFGNTFLKIIFTKIFN